MKLTPFTTKNEDVYDIVSDELNTLKSLGIVEDWVEMEDAYQDEVGNVYVATVYHEDVFEEEGHGKHLIVESEPDQRAARLVISMEDINTKLHHEFVAPISNNEEIL